MPKADRKVEMRENFLSSMRRTQGNLLYSKGIMSSENYTTFCKTAYTYLY